MIIRETFEPIELKLLAERLNNVLAIETLHKIDFGYNTEFRTFEVNYWVKHNSSEDSNG